MHKSIYHNVRVHNLTKIMEEQFGNWHTLCAVIDKSSSYISEVIKGIRREFTENLARNIETKLKLHPGTLDIKNEILCGQRYVIVKLYSPVLSAGAGNEPLFEEHLGELSVPIQLVKEKNLDVTKLVCLRVEGDSMEEKINDGAYVIIDTSKKEIINNKIYAFNINNLIRVKRLFNGLDGIIIRSDNPLYPEEKITFEEMKNSNINFFVIGKVELILNME
ncbi:MAG: hypothetical protein KBD37_03110 [Burkholderiales bacterium]|nr:hypothetical protein [Burkholderiales bacterium]